MLQSCVRGRERIIEINSMIFSFCYFCFEPAFSLILSVKVLEATYSPPSPPGLWFISCFFLSEAPFISLFGTRRGIRSLTATSTVAVSDVLSWNKTSFPPTESRSEAVSLTKGDRGRWARQVLSFLLVSEVQDLLGFPVIHNPSITTYCMH